MSENKDHSRSLSERQYHTQVHNTGGHDRRFSADDEKGRLAAGGVESRPVPIPRSRPNLSTAQSSGINPDPQNGGASATTVFNPSGDSLSSNDVEKLRAQLNSLQSENNKLKEALKVMREGEERLLQREQAIAERERELSLKESRMESKSSDKEFELNQKQRDLQRLEDQLHMKSKDLQHKEFDLLNADGPEDISSSKMADLADRTYELDKREEQLKRKEEGLQDWQQKLNQDKENYQRRVHNLQLQESTVQGSTIDPINRTSHSNTSMHQQYHHNQGYGDDYRQVPRRAWTEYTPASSTVDGSYDISSEVRPIPEPSLPQQQISNSEVGIERCESVPFPDNPLPRPSPPRDDPVFSPPPPPPAAEFVDYADLARQIAEEEEKKEQELRDQQLLNDALLALQLQDELMGTDPVANVSERDEDTIKRDLGSRLTQVQNFQRREQEDYMYAQNLEETNNAESNN